MLNDTRAFEGPAGDRAPCKPGRKGWGEGSWREGKWGVLGAAEGARGEKLGLLEAQRLGLCTSTAQGTICMAQPKEKKIIKS